MPNLIQVERLTPERIAELKRMAEAAIKSNKNFEAVFPEYADERWTPEIDV